MSGIGTNRIFVYFSFAIIPNEQSSPDVFYLYVNILLYLLLSIHIHKALLFWIHKAYLI